MKVELRIDGYYVETEVTEDELRNPAELVERVIAPMALVLCRTMLPVTVDESQVQDALDRLKAKPFINLN